MFAGNERMITENSSSSSFTVARVTAFVKSASLATYPSLVSAIPSADKRTVELVKLL
jgi:hypothetical protein